MVEEPLRMLAEDARGKLLYYQHTCEENRIGLLEEALDDIQTLLQAEKNKLAPNHI